MFESNVKIEDLSYEGEYWYLGSPGEHLVTISIEEPRAQAVYSVTALIGELPRLPIGERVTHIESFICKEEDTVRESYGKLLGSTAFSSLVDYSQQQYGIHVIESRGLGLYEFLAREASYPEKSIYFGPTGKLLTKREVKNALTYIHYDVRSLSYSKHLLITAILTI